MTAVQTAANQSRGRALKCSATPPLAALPRPLAWPRNLKGGSPKWLTGAGRDRSPKFARSGANRISGILMAWESRIHGGAVRGDYRRRLEGVGGES